MGSKSAKCIFLFALMLCCAASAMAQRKITPVNNASTATQPINEMEGDTARINARMRASMTHYHDENGNVVYVDTVTGREWRDSTMITAKKPMQYPLWESASVGVDLWNPLMRAFGQHYGLIDFMAQVSIHNRYKPTFETGLGIAKNTPAENNFTYKAPLSVYFRLGMDYNFLYNSTPDYQFFVGLRLGMAPFKYSIEDISINSSYWDETAHPEIPSQSSTVLWWEFAIGLRVKLFGPVSAGWTFRYHNIMSETKNVCGLPWYIPGYGTRGTAISGSLTITYTLPISRKKPAAIDLPDNATSPDPLFFPEEAGQPSIEQIQQGSDAENPE